jgi:large subunit ribosomal protein L9
VKVILLQAVDELGHKGQEIEVAPGRARNHLLPRRLAVYATAETTAAHRVTLSAADAAADAAQRAANLLRKRVEALTLTLTHTPVTAGDVAAELAASSLRLRVAPEAVRVPADAGVTQPSFDVRVEAAPDLWCVVRVNVNVS